MNPTLVANAYLVITFLSINIGFIYGWGVSATRLPEIILVGVDGADWNLWLREILFCCYCAKSVD